MIRTMLYSREGKLITDTPLDQISEVIRDPENLLWVDFQGEPPEACEPILLKTFGFHPLAVDDALQETHSPKVDDWDDYLYIVLQPVVFDKEVEVHIDTPELDAFLGEHYLVTHHDQVIPALDRVWGTAQRDERALKLGSDHMLYRIADELAVDYMNVVDDLADEIETIEDLIFAGSSPKILPRASAIKRAMLRMRRSLSPQREVLNKLARDDYRIIDAKDRVYFRDVYDHLVRLYDITESLRDLLSGTLDIYLSVINNRMNDIMKTLTVITTLFMPLSFIASFFGQNFFQPVAPLKAWTAMPSFLITLAIMLLIPLTMFLWMRRRGWM
jgi:magnesium transporter